MPTIFINGTAVEAKSGATVLEVARREGHDIPCFCWHEKLSTPGNCRLCVVETEEGGWLDIACNMPVADGLRVLTDSEKVREHRQVMLQLLTLNHPIDCGICDKAGECKLQDYYYEHNGAPSASIDKKVRLTKFVPLNERIVLDNERCVLCTRCVRFTREISKSNGLGIVGRADHAMVRAAENGSFATDAYSDNVIDLCPVGALQSRSFLASSRVWYLTPTQSICPGCERGCNIDIWHRSQGWQVQALDAHKNVAVARVTPRQNDAVNGPWVCNKARDLSVILDRPRAAQAMMAGKPVTLDEALASARESIERARRPLALVSTWGSNEELAAFKDFLGERFTVLLKHDHLPQQGEVVEDEVLIRPDKNPNSAGARTMFPNARWWTSSSDPSALHMEYDLVLVWGEGFDTAVLPSGMTTILMNAYDTLAAKSASVFIPISNQTERSGHYTNFQGRVGAFEACVEKAPGVAHAEDMFVQLTETAEA